MWVVRGGVVSRPAPQLVGLDLERVEADGRAVLPPSCLTNTPIFVTPAAPNAVATGTGGADAW